MSCSYSGEKEETVTNGRSWNPSFLNRRRRFSRWAGLLGNGQSPTLRVSLDAAAAEHEEVGNGRNVGRLALATRVLWQSNFHFQLSDQAMLHNLTDGGLLKNTASLLWVRWLAAGGPQPRITRHPSIIPPYAPLLTVTCRNRYRTIIPALRCSAAIQPSLPALHRKHRNPVLNASGDVLERSDRHVQTSFRILLYPWR